MLPPPSWVVVPAAAAATTTLEGGVISLAATSGSDSSVSPCTAPAAPPATAPATPPNTPTGATAFPAPATHVWLPSTNANMDYGEPPCEKRGCLVCLTKHHASSAVYELFPTAPTPTFPYPQPDQYHIHPPGESEVPATSKPGQPHIGAVNNPASSSSRRIHPQTPLIPVVTPQGPLQVPAPLFREPYALAITVNHPLTAVADPTASLTDAYKSSPTGTSPSRRICFPRALSGPSQTWALAQWTSSPPALRASSVPPEQQRSQPSKAMPDSRLLQLTTPVQCISHVQAATPLPTQKCTASKTHKTFGS